jgi:hypothetical protein
VEFLLAEKIGKCRKGDPGGEICNPKFDSDGIL